MINTRKNNTVNKFIKKYCKRIFQKKNIKYIIQETKLQ